jgi:hypothetical protein
MSADDMEKAALIMGAVCDNIQRCGSSRQVWIGWCSCLGAGFPRIVFPICSSFADTAVLSVSRNRSSNESQDDTITILDIIHSLVFY